MYIFVHARIKRGLIMRHKLYKNQWVKLGNSDDLGFFFPRMI